MAGTRITKPSPRGEGFATYAYVGLVCALALALLGWAWWRHGVTTDYVAFVVLATLGVLSWLLRETDVGHRVQFSFTSIILLASGVIVGPFAAGLIGALSVVTQATRARPAVRIFNAAMVSIVGSVGGLVYLAAGGMRDVVAVEGPANLLLNVGLPLLVADIAQCVANAVLLAGVMRASAGVPMRPQILKLLSTTGVAYVGYGIIGFIFVVLWIPAEVGWFSAILVLAPLFVARWAFVQYGAEVAVHERTLNALVMAVETKDPHSAGHSGRVAQLCEWIAEALGLGFKEIQDVRTAGMLHDLGKVAVPTRLLRSRRQLTDDELLLMGNHPLEGVEMLQEIDFLRDSREAIAHHHERFDGRGYPHGLNGERIPLAARIVAVADAFDALTTARSYRPAHTSAEAVKELTRRGGTQLDPLVVAALGRALHRHEWTPTVPSGAMLAAGVALDHDDPEMSDLFAGRPDLRARIKGIQQVPHLTGDRTQTRAGMP